MIEKKRTHYERLCREYERSGASKREFCAERGVNESTLEYWLTKLRKESTSESFVSLSGESVELELPSGVRLRVSANNLKAVLRALE